MWMGFKGPNGEVGWTFPPGLEVKVAREELLFKGYPGWALTLTRLQDRSLASIGLLTSQQAIAQCVGSDWLARCDVVCVPHAQTPTLTR